MITINTGSTFEEKQGCCGCGACANSCVNHCITMRKDAEGFFYPEIDSNNCIDCGLCEKVCPIKQTKAKEPFKQEGYIVQHKNELVRRQSTAGGAFTAIAEYTIDLGGVVFGAAYTADFIVKHVAVEQKKELWRFRNSKYVQSETVDAFRLAKEYLLNGRIVCFSGTPCQIEGLLGYLQKPYDNLITVDVVCHAVPSPLIFEKYVEMQKQRFDGNISDLIFREKHYGYKYSTMTVKNNSGTDLYAYGIETDPMLRAFFSNICDRPSCHDCQFKKQYRDSDFTIWDCFAVASIEKGFNDDKGTTSILIHSDKGKKFFKSIINTKNIRTMEVDPLILTKGCGSMYRSSPIHPKRQQFMKDALVLDGQTLFKKWFPISLRLKCIRAIRVLLVKLGIYDNVKWSIKNFLKYVKALAKLIRNIFKWKK